MAERCSLAKDQGTMHKRKAATCETSRVERKASVKPTQEVDFRNQFRQ